MLIKKELYLQEMERLCRQARERLLASHPDMEIYAVSVWTDPGAAASAISIETLENSELKTAEARSESEQQVRRLKAQGQAYLARIWRSTTKQIKRNTNPVDFALPNISELNHRAFTKAQGRSPAIWKELRPLLLKVQKIAQQMFSGPEMKTHLDAELALNSRQDWYDHVIPLRPTTGKKPGRRSKGHKR